LKSHNTSLEPRSSQIEGRFPSTGVARNLARVSVVTAGVQVFTLDNLPAIEALVALQSLLLDSDPAIRLAALVALGEMNHPAGWSYLIAMLRDPAPLVRIAALEALAAGHDNAVIGSID